MNIKCSKCETIFDLQINIKKHSKIKLKCSVCGNKWEESFKDNINGTTFNGSKAISFKKLIFLNIIIVIIVFIFVFVFREELENIDYYWKSLYLFLDNLMPI